VRTFTELAALTLVGLIAGGALAFALASTFGLDLGRVVFAILPGVIGTAIWRAEHRPLIHGLSWAVPLTIWCLVAFFVASDPAGTVMYVLGIGFLTLMVFTESLPALWVRRIVRRKP